MVIITVVDGYTTTKVLRSIDNDNALSFSFLVVVDFQSVFKILYVFEFIDLFWSWVEYPACITLTHGAGITISHSLGRWRLRRRRRGWAWDMGGYGAICICISPQKGKIDYVVIKYTLHIHVWKPAFKASIYTNPSTPLHQQIKPLLCPFKAFYGGFILHQHLPCPYKALLAC